MYHLSWLNEPSLIILYLLYFLVYFIPNVHVTNTFAPSSDISIAIESKVAPWKILHMYIMFKKWLT